MLTLPVNATSPAANGAMLKPHAAASDAGTQRPPLLVPTAAVQSQGADAASEGQIEPELPSSSALSSVNASVATAANRTILQELALNIAAALKIARRPDETLTALFSRIIATIDAMPQAERLQLEIRTGLKALKITLADLAAALRKPDGPEAARLTAMMEAPTTVPARAAASAATTTYLQQGTADGHAEESLAMRAAARSAAAGQNVFSAESRLRPATNQPADGSVLQNQLKTMFEPGETRQAAVAERPAASLSRLTTVLPEGAAQVAMADSAVIEDAAPMQVATEEAVDTADDASDARPKSSAQPQSETATNTTATGGLKVDAQTVDKIRMLAQTIAAEATEPSGTPDAVELESDEPEPGEQPARMADAKSEQAERRATSALSFRGLVEAFTTLPGKAAEMLAQAAQAAQAGEAPQSAANVDRASANGGLLQAHFGDKTPVETVPKPGITPASLQAASLADPAQAELDARPPAISAEQAATAGMERDNAQAQADRAAPPRPDLLQHAVPFAHAMLQPARDAMVDEAQEEETRGDADDEAAYRDEDDAEKRRPRDEYDAIHDPAEEDLETLVINRDSSEADRAFAMYQRMGGF